MNTRQVQDTIAQLKTADIAAYKAGQKSNFVLDYVRNELITRAFKADKDLKKEVEVELNMTISSYIAPSLALLSKDGNYERLFSKSVMTFDNGNIKFAYKINVKGLSDEYKNALNTKLGISIPVAAPVV